MAKKIKKSVKPVIVENPVHVRIDNPIAFRKQILTCALESTQLLKGYSEIKEMQEKRKIVLMQKLQRTMDSLDKMSKKLEAILPKVKYTEEKRVVPQPVIVQKPQPKVEIKKPDTETDKLKQELAEIERKLAEL